MELTEQFESNCLTEAYKITKVLPNPVVVLVTSHTIWFPFHIAVAADDRVYHFRRVGNPYRFWRFIGSIEVVSITDALTQLDLENRKVIRYIEGPNRWTFVFILMLAVVHMPSHVVRRLTRSA